MRIRIAFVQAPTDVDKQDLINLGDGETGTVTKTQKEGGIVAIYYLGTLFGALAGGALSYRIGRNYAIIIAGFWVCLGNLYKQLPRM